ncbi:hypothetical protein SEVIR_4G015433v4 [Setaria viridis]
MPATLCHRTSATALRPAQRAAFPRFHTSSNKGKQTRPAAAAIVAALHVNALELDLERARFSAVPISIAVELNSVPCLSPPLWSSSVFAQPARASLLRCCCDSRRVCLHSAHGARHRSWSSTSGSASRSPGRSSLGDASQSLVL